MKCICNFRYAQSKKGGAHFPDVKGLLRYVQFRDDRDDHVPGHANRWLDGGLGASYPQILARLDHLSPGNRDAYCFSIVISPDPEDMAEVKGDPYERFVETIRDTMEEWENWRLDNDSRPQAGRIEYSFVVHRPEREYGEQMHAHLILPAATEHPATGDKTPLYNYRPHIEAFKEIAGRQLDRTFELDLDRSLELSRERDRLDEERQRERELDREREREMDELEDLLPEREIPFFSFMGRDL
jgi:hypothetical protein